MVKEINRVRKQEKKRKIDIKSIDNALGRIKGKAKEVLDEISNEDEEAGESL
jgi:hypothetical protein